MHREQPLCASDPGGITVLVVDDDRAIRSLLEGILRLDGHRVLLAGDGVEALEVFRRERPEVVLMDIQMPRMNGLDAAARISDEAQDYRPLLAFLTATSDQQTMLEGLALADDLIMKPIDCTLLEAKLRAYARQAQTRRLLREQQQRIERLNDVMRRESEVAAHVMGRVLAHTELPDGRLLQYRVQPSTMFSGDMVLARNTPAGRLHILLADAVGHGLPAAINILPLFFPFDGMSRKGCPLATIARELNARVRDLLPVDRFVTATLIGVDQAAGTLEIWNGGNPQALVFDRNGTLAERVDSMQIPLGLNEDRVVLFEPRRLNFDSGTQLLVCSDGIWENAAFACDDPALAIAGLMAATPPADRLTALFRVAVDAGQSDDLSAVLVAARGKATGQATTGRGARVPVGRLSLHLGPVALAAGDALDGVVAMAATMGLERRFPVLPLVLAELFANALDYGVLGLDDSRKYESAEDFLDFARQREQRLGQLHDGFVAIEATPDLVSGRPVLRLSVADSGQGFDWTLAVTAVSTGDPDAGRGLQLVRRRVVQLEFNAHGSEVIVLIPAAEDV